MKMKWNLSLKRIIVIAVLALGIYKFIDGIISFYHINNIGEMKDIQLSDLRYRQYFEGNIDYIVGTESKMEGEEGILYPICVENVTTDIHFEDRYYLACIDEEENNYVCIVVPRKFLKKFENFYYPEKDYLACDYYFKCKVVNSTSFSDELLKTYHEIFDRDININKSKILKIVDYHYEQKRLMIGICIFVCSLIVLGIFLYSREHYHYEIRKEDELLAIKNEFIIEPELIKIISLENEKNYEMKAIYMKLKKRWKVSLIISFITFIIYAILYSNILLCVVSVFMSTFILNYAEFIAVSKNKLAKWLAKKRNSSILEEQIEHSDAVLAIYYSKLHELRSETATETGNNGKSSH